MDTQTLYDDLIAFLSKLTTSQGEGVGSLFNVLPWEREFLLQAIDPDIRVAALSMARGGGKSTFLGAIAAAALAGPLQQQRGDVIIVSGILSQARIVFSHAKAFLGITKSDQRYSVVDNTTIAEIKRHATGSKLRAIASNPDFAHGLAPVLVICDEPAKWQHQTSDRMWAALKTSLGKVPGSKVIAIGTLPEDGTHWFSRLFEEPPPDSHCKLYQAQKDCPLEDVEQWKAANPSLAFFPTLMKAYDSECRDAEGNSQAESEFRALRLNLGTPEVDDRDVLVSLEVWKGIQQHAGTGRYSGPYCFGLDLGGSDALSAAAGFWLESQELKTMAAVGDNPSLLQRGKQDGVSDLYVRSQQSRHLIATPGRVADVGMLLEACFLLWGKPVCIVADSYRQSELMDIIEKRGWAHEVDLVFRSPGYKDASEDVRLFRDAAISGRLRVESSILLDHHVGRAVVQSDTSGHVKLAKRASAGRSARHRDDLAAASILAVAHGVRLGASVEVGTFCAVV